MRAEVRGQQPPVLLRTSPAAPKAPFGAPRQAGKTPPYFAAEDEEVCPVVTAAARGAKSPNGTDSLRACRAEAFLGPGRKNDEGARYGRTFFPLLQPENTVTMSRPFFLDA